VQQKKTTQKTRTEGAIKGGDGKYIFPMTQMDKIEAGVGYSTAVGPVIEGERMQCGLITKKARHGFAPHLHPNEQWNYIVKGTLRVKVGDQPSSCADRNAAVFPANIVHYTISTRTRMSCFLR